MAKAGATDHAINSSLQSFYISHPDRSFLFRVIVVCGWTPLNVLCGEWHPFTLGPSAIELGYDIVHLSCRHTDKTAPIIESNKMPLYLLLSLFRTLLLLKVSIREKPPFRGYRNENFFQSPKKKNLTQSTYNTNIFLLDTQWRLQFRVCLDRPLIKILSRFFPTP